MCVWPFFVTELGGVNCTNTTVVVMGLVDARVLDFNVRHDLRHETGYKVLQQLHLRAVWSYDSHAANEEFVALVICQWKQTRDGTHTVEHSIVKYALMSLGAL